MLAARLAGHFRHLEVIRRRCERVFANGDLTRHDIEYVYMSLFLDAVVSFERFIEDLFVGYLSGRLRPRGRVISRVSFRSDAVARDVVLGGRQYVDWVPYEQYTIKRAEAFFRGGYPFTKLNKAERDTLEQVLFVRNAIAHKSRHAIKSFEEKVLSGLPLVGHERTPAGFLRSLFRSAPNQTRHENLLLELSAMTMKLAV